MGSVTKSGVRIVNHVPEIYVDLSQYGGSLAKFGRLWRKGGSRTSST